jgi:hypothetical protein
MAYLFEVQVEYTADYLLEFGYGYAFRPDLPKWRSN